MLRRCQVRNTGRSERVGDTCPCYAPLLMERAGLLVPAAGQSHHATLEQSRPVDSNDDVLQADGVWILRQHDASVLPTRRIDEAFFLQCLEDLGQESGRDTCTRADFTYGHISW